MLLLFTTCYYYLLLLVTLYREETGEESYLIPVGGSVPLGNWGYFECFEEIRQQVSLPAQYYLLNYGSLKLTFSMISCPR